MRGLAMKRESWGALALTLGFLLWSAPTAAQDRGFSIPARIELAEMARERRVALVIGNARYAESPLRNPANDAHDVAAALRAMGFEVIEQSDLDQAGMKRAILDFGKRIQGGGVSLFFYAGHAIQTNGRNYLIPIGARIEGEPDVEIEGVDVGAVLSKMEQASTRLNIVVLDACRNNPFARSFRSTNKGLAFTDAPSGTLIAYATAPGDVAADGGGRNGAYTGAMLARIRTPGLEIGQLFRGVRTEVKTATGGQQIPWESSSLEGDFYFVLPGQQAAKALVPSDSGLTLAELGRLCDGGAANRCMEAARAAEAGLDGNPDRLGALGFYTKACVAGDLEGCYQQGWYLSTGQHGAVDQAAAQAPFKRACDGNHPKACANLGYLTINGFGTTASPQKAIAFFQKACDLNEGNSCSQLGSIHFHGSGVGVDLFAAGRFFTKGCDLNDGLGCLGLGYQLDRGEGVGQDLGRAVMVYQKACDMNFALACNNLGYQHEVGRGAPLNPAQAMVFYKKACDLGDGNGCSNLGKSHHAGRGTKVDLVRAAELYAIGCDRGIGEACNYEAELIKGRSGSASDLQAARARYEKACALNFAGSCTALGDMQELAEGGPRDDPSANTSFQRACDLGDGNGCLKMAFGYEFMHRGVAQSFSNALSLYDKSCQKGVQEGCFRKGHILARGAAGAVDLPGAVALYTQACAGNNAQACIQLGWHIEIGSVGSADPSRAAGLYKKGCDLSDMGGCDQLARLCGVSRVAGCP